MDKYYIEYIIPTHNVILCEKIEFNLDSKSVHLADIKQRDQNSLFLKFYFDNEIDFDDGIEETRQQLNNILNTIAFNYTGASIRDAYYSGESNLKNAECYNGLDSCIIVRRQDLEDKLAKALSSNTKYEHRYYEMFRLAVQSTDVVNKYMFLYQILLDIYGPAQWKTDECITCIGKRLGINSEFKKWQENRKYDGETKFTFIRNQVGHVIEGHTPQSTTKDMFDNLNELESLVKYAISEKQ